MIILPITYLGGVEWFSHLLRGGCGGCVVDLGENWVKQTFRNRTEILTAGGVATLTVPVHGGSGCGGSDGTKMRVRDVRVDNSRRWQHGHWMSIVSAYRASPFFEHYEERFAGIYERRFEFLVDLNLELLGVVAPLLGLDPGAMAVADEYVAAAPGDVDLRGKKALRRERPGGSAGGVTCGSGAVFREYVQVFYDRMPFIGGLSVIDLLFCEGPAAREYLINGE